MSKPQSVVLPSPGPFALFLVLNVKKPSSDGKNAVSETAARLLKPDALEKSAKLGSSVAIGHGFWKKAGLGPMPKELAPFKAIRSGRFTAPATHGDLFIHLTSKRHDLNFRLASEIVAGLGPRATVTTEVHGFCHLDSRDLTGFIDGTENPSGRERASAALVSGEDPDFAGGSYVYTQRYIHDLAGWNRQSVKMQERIIGRTKAKSVQLDPLTSQSHVDRVVIEENGAELQILRHSFPYGTTTEAGLFFVAYSKTPSIPHKMLARMMGTSGDGKHDRLMEFSKPVTGANFFAPSVDWLKAL